jgi:hypothetical protein
MSESFDYVHTPPELLSLGEAGRMTGKPKAYLRELAEAGQLSVRLEQRAGEAKIRVTRSGLAEAGLFPRDEIVPQFEQGNLGDLIALVREQTNRISALEEQRFQLGAQLGMAIQRVAMLEEKISAIPQPDFAVLTETVAAEPNSTHPSKLPAALVASALSLRVMGSVRSRFASARSRIAARGSDDRTT